MKYNLILVCEFFYFWLSKNLLHHQIFTNVSWFVSHFFIQIIQLLIFSLILKGFCCNIFVCLFLGDWNSDDKNVPNENRQTLQQLLTHLLRALERRDPQQLFAWPVTDRIAPNYSRLISKPMDFETIRRNIQSNQYTNLNAFVVSIDYYIVYYFT